MALLRGNDILHVSERDSSSRYYYTKTVTDENNNTVYDLYKFTDLSESATFDHIVTEDERGRLDIIADRYFGSPKYWWMIAMANNMCDPFVILPGMKLKIPSADAFHNLNT